MFNLTMHFWASCFVKTDLICLICMLNYACLYGSAKVKAFLAERYNFLPTEIEVRLSAIIYRYWMCYNLYKYTY